MVEAASVEQAGCIQADENQFVHPRQAGREEGVEEEEEGGRKT